MAGTVKLNNFTNVINNLKLLISINQANTVKGINLAGNVLESAVKKHASLTDHSLKDLADMGHPYSTKKSGGPHPDYEVHKQSGLLQENIIKNAYATNNMAGVEVGVLEDDVPYIKYLIEGTSKMRPRDFISHAGTESKDSVSTILINAISPK
jgi:HK97 gp10 family phage protein